MIKRDMKRGSYIANLLGGRMNGSRDSPSREELATIKEKVEWLECTLKLKKSTNADLVKEIDHSEGAL